MSKMATAPAQRKRSESDEDDLPDKWPDFDVHDPTQVTVTNVSSSDDSMLKLFEKAKTGRGSVYSLCREKRGIFLLLSNEDFKEARDRDKSLGDRRGTDKDRTALNKLFTQLGFKVVEKSDLSAQEMLEAVRHEGRQDHTGYDCFACAVLSHGERGRVFGTDGELVSLDDLKGAVDGDNSPTLIGKPRLFFIQACQGTLHDRGTVATEIDTMVKELVEVDIQDATESDATNEGRISPMSGVFVAMATVADYVSWRNTSFGTWFIQAIVYVFSHYAHKYELLHLMTMVNCLVSRAETSNGLKQVSTCAYTFTKIFYFFPGLPQVGVVQSHPGLPAPLFPTAPKTATSAQIPSASGSVQSAMVQQPATGQLAAAQGSVTSVKVSKHPTAGLTQAQVQQKTRETQLVTACVRGSLAMVKSLVDKGQASVECSVDMTVGDEDYKGMTPLWAASTTGNVDIVKYIVKRGASVKSYHVAEACIGGHVETVRHLLEKGADVNSTNNNDQKRTLLIIASREGHVDIVTALLTRGASVNTTDNDGYTALMHACHEGHVDIVTALLTRGASVNTTNNNGSTALMHACHEGHVDIVTALLTRGASVNTTNNNGWTALMSACLKGHVDIVTALLAHEADVNIAVPSEDDRLGGRTALHENAINGNVPILELLLSHGATFSRDCYGDTPLLLAACEPHDDYVDRCLRVPDMSRSDKADALEVLGAKHWTRHQGTCPEQWQRAMEERHRAGRPAVCKKTARKVAVVGLATEVQTPGELDKLRQSADRLALGTQAVLVAERVLGKAHRITEFIIRNYALLYADNDRYGRALKLLLYSLENMSAVNPFKGYSMLCHAQVVAIQVRGQRSASPNLRFCDGLTFLRRTVSALTRAGAAPSGSQDRFPTERQHLLRIALHAVCLLQRTLSQASPAERRDYLQAVKELVGRNFRGEGGDTLLHMACDADTEVFSTRMDLFKGCPFPSPEVVRALLEAGCDRSTRNTAGLTALQVAGDHALVVGLLSLSVR